MAAYSQTAEYRREYRRKNHERVLEREAAYRAAHREQVRLKESRWYWLHRDEVCAARRADPERLERKRAWRKAHPEQELKDRLRRKARSAYRRHGCGTDPKGNVRALGLLGVMPAEEET